MLHRVTVCLRQPLCWLFPAHLVQHFNFADGLVLRAGEGIVVWGAGDDSWGRPSADPVWPEIGDLRTAGANPPVVSLVDKEGEVVAKSTVPPS